MATKLTPVEFHIEFKKGSKVEDVESALNAFAPDIKWRVDNRTATIFAYGVCSKQKYEKLFGARLEQRKDEYANGSRLRPRLRKNDRYSWVETTRAKVPAVLEKIVARISIAAKIYLA